MNKGSVTTAMKAAAAGPSGGPAPIRFDWPLNSVLAPYSLTQLLYNSHAALQIIIE